MTGIVVHLNDFRSREDLDLCRLNGLEILSVERLANGSIRIVLQSRDESLPLNWITALRFTIMSCRTYEFHKVSSFTHKTILGGGRRFAITTRVVCWFNKSSSRVQDFPRPLRIQIRTSLFHRPFPLRASRREPA